MILAVLHFSISPFFAENLYCFIELGKEFIIPFSLKARFIAEFIAFPVKVGQV